MPGLDKLVHIAVFALVMATGVLAGISTRLLLTLLLLQTAASELGQHLLLPERTGDPWDALADLVGIGLGWLTGSAALRLLARWRTRSP